jgi:predicted nucleic acid-binding protein
MPIAVIDASVIGRWLLPSEERSPGAEILRDDFLAGRITLVAPRVLRDETTSMIWNAVRDGRLSPDEASKVLRRSKALDIVCVSATHADLATLSLANDLRHSPYDCSYLWVALALGCNLYTADKRFVHVAQREYPCVRDIDEYSLR